MLRLVSVIIFIFNAAHATPISEAALFNRCYAHLTGHPVPVGNALMQKVRSAEITAVNACSLVLDKATLNAQGALSDANDTEAVAVINQFYNFHRSLFNVSSQEQLPEADREYGTSTDDLFDISQPALAMTKVLFGGHKYSELLTTLGDVRAVRRPNPKLDAQYGYLVNSPSRRYLGNNSTAANLDTLPFAFRNPTGAFAQDGSQSTQVAAPIIQTGDLIGIRPAAETLMVPNFTFYPLAPAGVEIRGDQAPGITLPFNAFQVAGAGVLGYPAYMLSYWGQGKNTQLNGTTKLPRRWAISTLQNFLCTNMPDLRPEDVGQYLDAGSPAPFRLQSSCLGCHATQDQMAYTLRNYALGFSDFFVSLDLTTGIYNAKTTELMAHYTPSQPSVAGWSSQPVTDFQLQAPSGRLLLRTLSGKLINQSVSDLNDLGRALTATDDYYLCAAKHYFQFFTGIQVPLFDRENPANAPLLQTLSPQSTVDRKYLEGLGQLLKNDPNQSLVTLVKAIISSDYYRDSDYRPK